MEENNKSLIQLDLVPKLEPIDEGYVLCGEYVDSIPSASTGPPLTSNDYRNPLTQKIIGDNPLQLKDVKIMVKDCLQDLASIQAHVKSEPEENIFDDESQEASLNPPTNQDTSYFESDDNDTNYTPSKRLKLSASRGKSSTQKEKQSKGIKQYINSDLHSNKSDEIQNCSRCKEQVTNPKGGVLCTGGCYGYYHFECTRLKTYEAFVKLGVRKKCWKCDFCKEGYMEQNPPKENNTRKTESILAEKTQKLAEKTQKRSTHWIYGLNKQEILDQLKNFGLPATNTLHEGRKVLASFIKGEYMPQTPSSPVGEANSDSPSTRKRTLIVPESSTESEITLSNLLHPSKKKKEDTQNGPEPDITLSNILDPSKKRKSVSATLKDASSSESDYDDYDSGGDDYESYNPRRSLTSKKKKKTSTLKKGIPNNEDQPDKQKEVDRVYWCCCEMLFENFSAYNQHKVQKHNIEELRCSVCIDQSFLSLGEIEKHYLDLHTNSSWTSFHCADCKLVFGVKSSFFDHKAKCSESLTCSEVLNSILDMVVAKENNSQVEAHKETDYRLSCCDKIIDNFEDFVKHKHTDHNMALLTCGLCLNMEESEDKLRSHYQRFHFSRYWKRLGLKKHGEDSDAGEGSSGSDDVGRPVQCSALQDGILCQCRDCSEILNETKPSCNNFIPPNKPFHCTPCNLYFSYKSRLDKHLRTHVGLKKYPCDICFNAFTTETSLKKHKIYKHSSNPPREICGICDKDFASKGSLKKHIAHLHLHLNKNCNLKCHQCGKIYSNQTSYKKHIRTCNVTIRKEFICADCNGVFFDRRYLISHIQTKHLLNGNFKCDKCDRIFNTENKRYMHKRKVHSDLQFNCEICGKFFKLKEKFKLHMAGHSDETPFICQTCGKGFKRECNLVQHQYTHSDSRSHVCNICGQTFKLRTHVKQHMAVHGLIRKYKCSVCDKAFAKKHELNHHLSSHGILMTN